MQVTKYFVKFQRKNAGNASKIRPYTLATSHFSFPIGLFRLLAPSNHQILLVDKLNSHPLRNPVTNNPITFAQIGNEQVAMITVVPVMILNRCIMATKAKIQPATRRAVFFDFIIKYY
jgi:hypothetical protein